MEQFRKMLAQMREFWTGLGFARRALLVVATVGAVAAVGAFAYLSGTNYVNVYRDLDIAEVGAMRTALTAQSIPNELSADGTAIKVPVERLAEARVALASAGLPSRGGSGFEKFDESSFLTTPFALSVNYQRALQGELARSIQQLEPIHTARVIIARPEPNQYALARDTKVTTASVTLKLKPGATMNRGSAAGIVSLVARSVEGLKPENVTVIDSAGRVLSDPHAADRDSLPTPQLEFRRELEAYLASKAQDLLAQTLGAGRVLVQVSADINFNRVKELQKTYSPERVARIERNTTTKNTGSAPRGIAGPSSNVARAGGTTPGATAGGSTASSEETATDYALSETVRDLEEGRGAVTRLSVAVIADLRPQGEGQPVISAADAEEIVKRAIGFRSGRDEVKLTNAPLPVSAAPEPDEALARLQRIQAYVGLARNVCLALACVLLVGIFGLLALRRRKPVEVPAPVADQAAGGAAGPAPAARGELDRLLDLARTDPDRAAAVFRTLLGAN
jgi:flagellar M-ring protein FliF